MAVWELAEHRWVFIEQRPEHAGHAMHTVLVDELDALIVQVAARGLERRSLTGGMATAGGHSCKHHLDGPGRTDAQPVLTIDQAVAEAVANADKAAGRSLFLSMP